MDKRMSRCDNIIRLQRELKEAREEYKKLLEMERQADPAYVDYYVYRIKAQEAMLASLKQEYMRELKSGDGLVMVR